ncbi:putative secreted protein with PEP-CTERM sorting signal [Nitrosospira sp. Nsp2]|uniref:HAF repeat-containing PEP-CTERM protein n=1 Tax=Nitrosospira sp. Nsp2 TaxID=136548 RepID=UPI000D30965F|nr:HAF repeat-containing PEP-CTERM protein [Nitrosospira sp. Nsp2]PTR14521.1 putative secreted protein with PEP-CTERM sorting signal [Nitrosospira sp. Nsp2]
MKIIRGFKVRGFILAAAFSGSLGFGTHVAAQEELGRSYLIDLNSKMVTDLGTLGGNNSIATGVNDAGQVAGYSDTAGGVIHAFITGPDGMAMRDLGTLGGYSSSASGINGAGQVVGYSDPGTGEGLSHAFITGSDGMDMRDLGDLGGNLSVALGINDAGQVAGWSDTAGGDQHAFITGPNGANMMDLNSLVHLPPGVTLIEAHGLNNAGQVIALATIVPEPEVYALFLAGLGLVGLIAHRRGINKGVF